MTIYIVLTIQYTLGETERDRGKTTINHTHWGEKKVLYIPAEDGPVAK